MKNLFAIFSRPRLKAPRVGDRPPEQQSAEYKAGYAHGITAGAMIAWGDMPPDHMLPFRDSPGDWCDGYTAGLREATGYGR